MSKDSSATTREQTPHANRTTLKTRTTRTATVIDALKRRAHAILNDRSIDAQSRAIIRYALETNDPWLAQLVRRANAGENIAETLSQTPEAFERDESELFSSNAVNS